MIEGQSEPRPPGNEPAKKTDRGEIAAALSVGFLGLLLLYEGRQYDFGTIVRVGPGLFPIALGVGLLMLSAGLCVEVVRERLTTVMPPLQPFLLVMSGIAAWGILVERFGLFAATGALVVLSSLAARPINPLRVGLLALFLSLFGYIVFIWGLQIPLRAFGR